MAAKPAGRFLLFALLLVVLPEQASADQDALLPCAGETETAETIRQRIENEWPLRGSGDAVTRYVQSLGARLAQASDHSHRIPWRFSTVRNLAPNAFSIGGGYVFITDGAVNFAQNESEVAAILAHEIGHQLAGHFCGPPASDQSDSFFDIFFPPDSEENRVGIGSLVLVIDPVKEQQADRIAVSILQASGYDPRTMQDLAGRLSKGDPMLHAMSRRRLKSLERIVANTASAPVQASKEFREIKRILTAEDAFK